MIKIENWQVRRADGNQWIPATVPGTVLKSYIDAGFVPDPLYDDNWNKVRTQDQYFTSNFEYRGSFRLTDESNSRRVILNFDALNWKADVYVNGMKLANSLSHREHSVEGAFIRGRFDVTELVRAGLDNVVEVLIYCNDTPGQVTFQGLAEGPGPNGGLLGADNPTLHASVGWDWIPTIPGRNIGLYGDVYITTEGEVQIVDPWIETKLNLTEKSATLAAENLLETFEPWSGISGDSFIVDLGEIKTLGSVTFTWGTESGGAAADLEYRNPELYKLESSVDGEVWQNFDAFVGGKVNVMFFGEKLAEANTGSNEFIGHSISDSVQGGTAIVPMDLSMFNMGKVDMPIFAPQTGRYIRFTVLKQREINGGAVITKVQSVAVYAESPQQVEQSTSHEYELDDNSAELVFRTEVKNNSSQAVSSSLSLSILPGELVVEIPVELAANESKHVEHTLTLNKPELWWPNTYGKQPLYTADVKIGASHKSFKFGVREFSYPIDGEILTLYCNGVRIVCRGGNWGMDDALKQDTPEVYDHKVHLHAHANFTMIRNWIGMTNHPAFYDACDKYGILVWDDFWLANPVDGPNPNDNALFMENAEDKVRNIRSHAAVAMYCGRNEGDPPEPLYSELPKLVARLDHTRTYFHNSAMAPVGSGGGYQLAYPGGDAGIKQYFNDVTSPVLRSERGIPNVPNLETLKSFLTPEHLYPINEVWALHDWTYHMNGPANSYVAALKTYLGGDFEIPADNVQGQKPEESDPIFMAYKAAVYKMNEEMGRQWTIEEFCKAAQLINYDNHRGLFDALSARRSNGLLMWMSQSSWYSFMWQTYDYRLDCNGGYYGCRAGCEPVKAIFDPRTEEIIVSNLTPETLQHYRVDIELYTLQGELVYEQSVELDMQPDTYGKVVARADFSKSDTDVCFLRLRYGGKSSTYWHNRAEYQIYLEIGSLPEPELELHADDNCFTVKNIGASVSVLTRLQIVDEDGNDILPVYWSDNNFALMPGEEVSVSAEFSNTSKKLLHFKVNSSSVPLF